MIDERGRQVHNGEPYNPNMGEGRYQDALRRFRQRIVDGTDLETDDSDEIGNKHTHSSWGLCDDSEEMYPDANDHIFPADFLTRGRLTPRPVAEADRRCPMDRNNPSKLERQIGIVGRFGCFYRCRIFRPRPRGSAPPTREEAIKLYDDLIAEREALHGKRTAADDGEGHWYPRGTRSL